MMLRPGFSPIMLGGGGSELTREVIGSAQDVNTTNHSYDGFDIGEADADRFIIAAIRVRENTESRVISSVTFDPAGETSVPAVNLKTGTFSGGGETVIAALYGATVPAGTTLDVDVVFDGETDQSRCTLYKVLGLVSTTPEADDDDSQSATLSVSFGPVTPTEGAVAIACATFDDFSSTDLSWTELAEDDDAEVENFFRSGAASKQDLPAAEITVTCTKDHFTPQKAAGALIVMR